MGRRGPRGRFSSARTELPSLEWVSQTGGSRSVRSAGRRLAVLLGDEPPFETSLAWGHETIWLS